MTKSDAEIFVELLETFMINIIRDQDPHDLSSRVFRLTENKKDLVKLLVKPVYIDERDYEP